MTEEKMTEEQEKILEDYEVNEENFKEFINGKDIWEITNYDADRYSFGNNVLYKLCKDNPKHDNDKIITAKVWLIGRSYAADIVRGQNKGREEKRTTEDFWKELLKNKEMLEELDNLLETLKNLPTIKNIIETHKYLIDKIPTKINKRSFASKYLHFHCPELFYIYDSRAKKGIKKFIKRKKTLSTNLNFDEEYYDFYLRCKKLKKYIEENYKITCNPRQIDMILLKSVDE